MSRKLTIIAVFAALSIASTSCVTAEIPENPGSDEVLSGAYESGTSDSTSGVGEAASDVTTTVIPIETSEPETSEPETSAPDTTAEIRSEPEPADFDYTGIFPEDKYSDVAEKWSDDRRYLLLTAAQNDDCFPEAACVVEPESGETRLLPTLEVYNRIITENPGTGSFLTLRNVGLEWDSDELLVDFELDVGVKFLPSTLTGSYTFDPEAGEIKDFTYEKLPEKAESPELSEDEIRAVVDENIDALTADTDWVYRGDYGDTQMELIGNIAALGKSALPYLDELIKENPHVGGTMPENVPWIVAMIAAYSIDPARYDTETVSPDGKYALKMQAGSFTEIEWGGYFTIGDERLSVIDTATREILMIKNANAKNRYYGSYTKSQVYWSPDSRYVAVSNWIPHMILLTDLVFDIDRREVIDLPDDKSEEVMIPILEWKNTEYSDRPTFTLGEWMENDMVRIDVTDGGMSRWLSEGWYTYDLANKKVVKVSISVTDQIDEIEISKTHKVKHNGFIYRYPEALVDMSVHYPVISGEASEKINKTISEYISGICDERMNSDSTAAGDSMSLKLIYEVTREDDEILSIHFAAQIAGGGSVQHVDDEGMTFDLKTGERLPLSAFYSKEEISDMLDSFFENLDQSEYGSFFNLYTLDELREDYRRKFDDVENYDSFWLGNDKLYLSAGYYPDYSEDASDPVHGWRGFVEGIRTGDD